MIVLSKKVIDEITRHAEREYPHECCGLLIGRLEDEGHTRTIIETYPITNEFNRATMSEVFNEDVEITSEEESSVEEERHHRMLIPPLEYARAERQYRHSGLGVVGNYHSHPDHPAEPSQYDLEHLAPWTTMSYIVVSVREGKASDLRSWELEADRSRFSAEQVKEV